MADLAIHAFSRCGRFVAGLAIPCVFQVWQVCGRFVAGLWQVLQFPAFSRCGRFVAGLWQVCGRSVAGLGQVWGRSVAGRSATHVAGSWQVRLPHVSTVVLKTLEGHVATTFQYLCGMLLCFLLAKYPTNSC